MPMAPPRPCVVCGVACSGGRCDRHKRRLRRRYERTEQRRKDQRFYMRKAWKRARGAKLNRQPLCEECAANGRTVAATEVHHVVERKTDHDRAYDLSNLQSLCKRCHARKSNEERGGEG